MDRRINTAQNIYLNNVEVDNVYYNNELIWPTGSVSNLILEYDSTNYTSGTTITDSSTNTYTGTISGSPSHDGDYFTFSNDYITTPDISSDIPGSDKSHTVVVWVYPTANGIITNYNGSSTPNTAYYHSGIEIVGGNLEVGLWNGAGITSTGNIGAVSFNQWHQLVLSYNGSVVKGYIDGEYGGQASVSWDSPHDGTDAEGTGGLFISFGNGSITNQGDGTDFDGKFGLIQIYDKALTDSEIESNYSSSVDSFSNPWSPSTDITTVAWIDASDSSNYTRSGTSLLSVTDKAGTYTMSVGGNPLTNNSTQNGLNVFDFDGSGDYLQSTTYSTQVSSGNHWAIGVFRFEGTDSTQDSLWSYETNGSPKRDYAISSGNGSNSWPGELDLDGLSSNRISTTIGNLELWDDKSLTQNQYHIVACWFNKSGNQIGVRVDGTNAFTPVNDYDNSLQTNQELRLMRNRSSQELDGKLGEFFAVADIPGTSGTDLTHLIKAEGYLAHKWGLTSSLPSGHTYKNSAP